MKNDRVDMFMDVTFKYGEEEVKDSVYIPFQIFIEAVKKFGELSSVTLDGTDTAIWNLLVDFDCLENLENNETIIEYCEELYKGSKYEEEDYEDFKDEYEMLHNLGEYAEEN